MRVVGVDARVWRVGRWLPWRPRYHRPYGVGELGTGGGGGEGDIVFLVIIVAVLTLAVIWFAVEWLLALVVMPVLAVVRLVWPVPWRVTARSCDPFGARVRFEAKARGWRASARSVRGAADDIHRYGEPRALAGPFFEDLDAGTNDAPAGAGLTAQLERGGSVHCRALVHGTGSPYAVHGWLEGWLVVADGAMVLAQGVDPLTSPRVIAVQGCRDAVLAGPDPYVRSKFGRCAVARFTGGDGRPYQIAVGPQHGVLLRLVLPLGGQSDSAPSPPDGP